MCSPSPLFLSSSSFPLDLWVGHFLSLWQNNWHKQLKRRKDSFSEISVHSHLAPLFLGLCWGRAWWWKGIVEQSCSPHGGQEAERDSQEGTRIYPSRHIPQWLDPAAGNQAFNTWAFRGYFIFSFIRNLRSMVNKSIVLRLKKWLIITASYCCCNKLSQHIFILLQLWRSEVWHGIYLDKISVSAGLGSSGGSWEDFFSLPDSESRERPIFSDLCPLPLSS
jgi:hypothetical protein